MKKIKVSWSILNAWSKGNKDEAIKSMAGIESEKNIYMERGVDIHKIISENKLRLIPELTEAATFEDKEKGVNYFIVDINDWLRLSLVIDVIDRVPELIVDWKASKLRSTEHNKLQIYIYALACKKLDIPVTKGIFATVDQAQSDNGVFCREYSMFKINEEKLELAENYIETVGGEIYSFLNNKV